MLPTGKRDRLTALLAPFARDHFLATHYQREVLHIARDDPAFFAEIFSVAELENMLVAGATDRTGFNMVRTGVPPVNGELLAMERPFPRARFTGKQPVYVLDPRTIVDRFNMGYSLVVNDAARFSDRLQQLCGGLQQDLGATIQANVYFTPAHAQGFDIHHDTHDTLVLQIEGSKTWRLFEPVIDAPIEGQTLPLSGKEAVPKAEVTLRPGDTIYIPRGVPHAARSGADRTLHVTLAIMPMRVIDLLFTLFDAAAHTNPEMRRSLPVDWQTSPAFAQEFVDVVRGIVGETLDVGRIELARELLLREFFALSRPEVDKLFSNTGGIAKADPQSTIVWRSDAPHLLRRRGNAMDVFVSGKSLTFPPECTTLIERLARTPMTVAEIDALLPVVGRHVLGALALEGLLRIEH
jgi:hypothetical protein